MLSLLFHHSYRTNLDPNHAGVCLAVVYPTMSGIAQRKKTNQILMFQILVCPSLPRALMAYRSSRSGLRFEKAPHHH